MFSKLWSRGTSHPHPQSFCTASCLVLQVIGGRRTHSVSALLLVCVAGDWGASHQPSLCSVSCFLSSLLHQLHVFFHLTLTHRVLPKQHAACQLSGLVVVFSTAALIWCSTPILSSRRLGCRLHCRDNASSSGRQTVSYVSCQALLAKQLTLKDKGPCALCKGNIQPLGAASGRQIPCWPPIHATSAKK